MEGRNIKLIQETKVSLCYALTVCLLIQFSVVGTEKDRDQRSVALCLRHCVVHAPRGSLQHGVSLRTKIYIK